MNPLLKHAPQLSKEQEKQYITQWKENQDSEAIGKVIHGRARWVYAVIRNMNLSPHIDTDVVFTDVIGELFMAMDSYDTSRGLSAYLYPIIKFAAYRSVDAQTPESTDTDVCGLIDEYPGSPDDVLTAIRNLIDSTPSDELNDTARLLIRRVLSGHPNTKIASMMGWNYEKTKSNVTNVRRYIAWRMVKDDLSAAPWIQDKDLKAMAEAYERSRRSSL